MEASKQNNPDHFKINDTYETEKVAGNGSTGLVYKGINIATKEPVAIKILNHELSKHDKFVQQLKIEIDKIVYLNHPNIVSVKEAGKDGEKCYIILEYVECESLAEYLKKTKVPQISDSVNILKQLALALKYTGDNNLIHKSVTPSNILISSNKQVKLSGFGINSALSTAWLTMTGTSNAHVEYMSPEQAEGEEADYRSDIYSFGIVAYQLLTGEVPFKRDATSKSILAVAMKHINSPPPSLSEKNGNIPSWLEDIILKCLEKKAVDRFQSGQEIYDHLNGQLSPYEDNTVSIPTSNEVKFVPESNADASDVFVPPDIKQVTVTHDEVKERKAMEKLSSASNRQSYQQKPTSLNNTPTTPQKGATGPISPESEIIKVEEVKNSILSAQVKILLVVIVVLLIVLIFKK